MKQKWAKLFQIVFITIFLLGGANLQTVFAQDEVPVATESAPQVTEPPQDAATDQPVVTEAPATEVVTVAPTDVVTEAVTDVATAEPTAVVTETAAQATEESIPEIIESLDQSDLVLVDENGEAISLASVTAEDTLASDDPWFEDPSDSTNAILYQTSCATYTVPAGYATATCHASSTPIQSAIDAAPDGATIHLEAATFQEQVDINNRVLTLVGAGNNSTTGTVIQSSGSSLSQTSGSYTYGTGSYYGLIYIHNNSYINLSNMVIDGNSISNPVNNSVFSGLFINNASVYINNVTLKNFDDSDSHKTGAGLLLNEITGGNEVNINNSSFTNDEFGVLGINNVDNVFGSSNTFSGNHHNTQGVTIETDDKKITICHWDEGKREFSTRTVSVKTTINLSNCTLKNSGHGGHILDILPAYDCSPTKHFLGQGDQATLANGCVTPSPAIKVTKTVTSSGPYAVNSYINYSITVENTGDVILHNVVITDTGANLGTCPASATLVVGATKTCTASHKVTQADLDAGSYDNTGYGDSNETDKLSSKVTTLFTQSPSLKVTKSVTSSGPYAVNSYIYYSIAVENTGNVTLHNVVITDTGANLGTCPASTTLAPGAIKTCTASHQVTQADLDAGSYDNTGYGDSNETDKDSSKVTTTFSSSAALKVTKSETSSGPYAVDDYIYYSIFVENTGTVTLHNVVITDSGADLGTCPATSLAPGASTSCTASHKVTQADLDAGSYNNTGYGDSDETDKSSSQVTTKFVQTPALKVTKSETSSGTYALDSLITYSILVENIGNITLHNVEITDTGADLGTCPVTSLAPGASTSCTASHTVTQADLDAGSYDNTGYGDSDETDKSSSQVTTKFVQDPALSVVKTVTSTGTYVLGSLITYDIVVTNTGNITLTNVEITDPAATLGVCPVVATLDVGDSVTCTASYTVGAGDVTTGSFTNTAYGDSEETDPSSNSVTSTVTTIPVVTATPPSIPVTGGGLLIPVTGIGGLIPVTGGSLIVSGLGHSCMTYNDGGVICWGLNASGQLGDGTNNNHTIPVFVENLTGVINLTAGSKHTCALNSDGEVWCWGENSSGQLGNGTTTNSSVPVMVTGLPDQVVNFTAGEEFTCAQLKNQEVWCWGKNDLGQLNDGTTANQLKPVKSKLTSILSLISGGQGALLGGDPLGNVNQWVNVQSAEVQEVADTIAISANRWGNSGCAVSFDGTVKCWTGNLLSAPVKDALPAIDVGSGLDHSCVIDNDETVSCWGTNQRGELGNGTNTDSTSATLVKNLAAVHTLAVGASHTCVLVGAGNTALCWGQNTYGQLGNNSNIDSNEPVFVVMP